MGVEKRKYIQRERVWFLGSGGPHRGKKRKKGENR